jgi:hypothetical protein
VMSHALPLNLVECVCVCVSSNAPAPFPSTTCQASLSLALLFLAYVLQQHFTPFVSARTVSSSLSITESELAARLADKDSGRSWSTAGAGPRGAQPVQLRPASARKDARTVSTVTAVGGGDGAVERTMQPSVKPEDSGYVAGDKRGPVPARSIEAIPVPGDPGQTGGGRAHKPRGSVDLATGLSNLLVRAARSSLRTLSLTIDYNNLVSDSRGICGGVGSGRSHGWLVSMNQRHFCQKPNTSFRLYVQACGAWGMLSALCFVW